MRKVVEQLERDYAKFNRSERKPIEIPYLKDFNPYYAHEFESKQIIYGSIGAAVGLLIIAIFAYLKIKKSNSRI